MLKHPAAKINAQLLAQALKALSHPKRARIFDLLMEGVHCNCELSKKLGLSLSLVSHHMRVLEEAGLVNSDHDPHDGRWIYYTVDQEAIRKLVEDIDRFLDVGRIQPRLPACGPNRGMGCCP